MKSQLSRTWILILCFASKENGSKTLWSKALEEAILSPFIKFYLFDLLLISMNIGRQIDLDCQFLEAERIMDYSLLVGVHFYDGSKQYIWQNGAVPSVICRLIILWVYENAELSVIGRPKG